jgi:aminoglycoside phosphotransferase (APT) family kinase protein
MALKEEGRRLRYRIAAGFLSKASQRSRCRPVTMRTTAGIARGLRRYLSERFGLQDARFLQRPRPVSNGWETHIFHFQLHGHQQEDYGKPLTLRLFPYESNAARVQHEFAILQHMNRNGFPVPVPLCVETSSAVLGGPFLIMEQVPGQTFFDAMLYQPWNMLVLPRQMAEILHRLHRLPGAGFPAPAGDFLERSLAEIADIIRDHSLLKLSAGLNWVASHRPPPVQEPCIVHLDFHPLNIMQAAQRRPVLLDWTMADVGDPHADLGNALMLLDCVPVRRKRIWQRVGVMLGRGLVRRLFLRAICRLDAVDSQKLTYYQAWAALRRLARAGQLLAGASDNYKPSAVRMFRPRHLRRLRHYFAACSGVAVSL